MGLTINGQPLDDTKNYTLATSDYVAIDGGDGYEMLKTARLLIPREQARFDSEVMEAAIVAKKVLAPKIEGRITRVDQVQKPKSDCSD